jgi:hypothetical protein
MSDAISSRTNPLLPASSEPQQRNCARDCASPLRIISLGSFTHCVTYSSDFTCQVDHVPFVGAPTAQFSRGPLFASDLIFPNNTYFPDIIDRLHGGFPSVRDKHRGTAFPTPSATIWAPVRRL